MANRIYELLDLWAGSETWHTCHQSDEERFNQAMHNIIRELGANLDPSLFKEALKQYTKQHINAEVLNDEWLTIIDEFTVRIESILEFELARPRS